MKPFFVYLLRCADGTFYVGHTDDLERRVAAHQEGDAGAFPRERRPVELVWTQEAATREEALSAELRIKGWSREKKQALIDGDRDRAPALSRARTGEEVGHAALRQAQPAQTERPGEAPEFAQALVHGDRRALAKSITLIESTRSDHRLAADALLDRVLPRTGRAMRLGISGVPGVGKSTFIERLGLMLVGKGHRVAVLAVDPSSTVSGGSILGDKTRMERLSTHPAAYIRPSPASGTLGGVAEKTRETMLLCEAAGYDVVIVETVGVGQSETAVASMTDMFVLLQLPNAGDDLQAIKKGVMEIADLVVINKSDLDPDAAARAQAHINGSLRVFAPRPGASQWTPRVLQLSALRGEGIEPFWSAVEEFHAMRHATGEYAARRKQQALAWMWDLVNARLLADFRRHPAIRSELETVVSQVVDARVAPSSAARKLLQRFEQEKG